jgi:hexosaminidase
VVQSWRGQASLADASKQGYRGLLSYGYYLDLMWSAERHYAVDPLGDGASNLNAEQRSRVLGGEACMWSEYVSPESIDSRIWPRAAVIAERLWSGPSVQDVPSMYARLEVMRRRLDWLALQHDSIYPQMLRRIAGADDARPVRVLADVVEPVKDYSREQLATTPATNTTPLNRLVDAARPESATAREFSTMVDEFVAGKANDATKNRMRTLLMTWKDNQVKLQPFEINSFLLKEAVPISQNLSALGAAGLQAMDYIAQGKTPSGDWTKELTTLAEQAKKPQGQLLLMVAPPIEKLIQAASGRQ